VSGWLPVTAHVFMPLSIVTVTVPDVSQACTIIGDIGISIVRLRSGTVFRQTSDRPDLSHHAANCDSS